MPVGDGPNGIRVYYAISDGDVTGTRIKGTIRGGGEWALIGSDGFLRVDVRTQIETHDGAFLYVQYLGFIEMNPAFETASESGNETNFGDQYFYTNPESKPETAVTAGSIPRSLLVRGARRREGALPTGLAACIENTPGQEAREPGAGDAGAGHLAPKEHEIECLKGYGVHASMIPPALPDRRAPGGGSRKLPTPHRSLPVPAQERGSAPPPLNKVARVEPLQPVAYRG